MVSYDLKSTAGLTAEQRREKEIQASREIMPNCVAPYTRDLFAAIETARQAADIGGPEFAVSQLRAKVVALDASFSNCVTPFGVTAYNFMQLSDGSQYRMPAFFDLAVNGARQKAAAQAKVTSEEERTATIAAAALVVLAAAAGSAGSNPNLVHVDGYSRRDGTFVRPHTRTSPNGTCADNLGGC